MKISLLFLCSKSYCPYCVKVKSLLNSIGAEAKVVELDEESE